MTIDLTKTGNHKQVAELLQGSVSPRPIAFASTIDSQGIVNLSPFSFFNVFSIRPAILVFSPSRRLRDNTTKHTLENVLEIPEAVINIVSYGMVEQASLASTEFEKGVDEFTKTGFTAVPSVMVKPPRVKEAPVSFECRVLEVKALGSEGGAGNLVICEVVMIHAEDYIFDASGKIDPKKIDTVARMGGDYYCRAHGANIFEVPKPLTTIGIGVDQLPDDIRNSQVLTGNNLGRLANVQVIPSPDEVKDFAKKFDYDGISKMSGEDRRTAIHSLAKNWLEKGEIKNAWLLLLSNTHPD